MRMYIYLDFYKVLFMDLSKALWTWLSKGSGQVCLNIARKSKCLNCIVTEPMLIFCEVSKVTSRINRTSEATTQLFLKKSCEPFSDDFTGLFHWTVKGNRDAVILPLCPVLHLRDFLATSLFLCWLVISFWGHLNLFVFCLIDSKWSCQHFMHIAWFSYYVIVNL